MFYDKRREGQGEGLLSENPNEEMLIRRTISEDWSLPLCSLVRGRERKLSKK